MAAQHPDMPATNGYMPVTSVAFSATGRYIAAGNSNYFHLRVWNATRYNHPHDHPHPHHRTHQGAERPQGVWDHANSSNRDCPIDQLADAHPPAMLHGHTSHIMSVSFSPCCEELVGSASCDGTIRSVLTLGYTSYVMPLPLDSGLLPAVQVELFARCSALNRRLPSWMHVFPCTGLA
jgi:WD40 repeat protein